MLVFTALLSCWLKYTSAWTFRHREIFECTHLKFTVSGQSKQTSIDTHTRVQCSHASVGLAQARPNKIAHIIGNELVANHMLKMHKYPSKLNHIVWNSHLNSLSFTIHEFAISAHTYSYRVFQSTPNSIAIAMPITPNNLRGSNFQKFPGGAEILKEVPSCSVQPTFGVISLHLASASCFSTF